MLLTNVEINSQIDILIAYLNRIQHDDGSYQSFYFYSANQKKEWISWGFPPYDTAVVILALQSINNNKSSNIISKSINFLLNQSLDKRIWKYSSGQGYNYLLYDTDATAICSTVLKKSDYNIDNIPFLDCFIDKENNYKTWITPNFTKTKIPFKTNLKLVIHNIKALYLKKLNISLSDKEFSMNCNILLYTGKTKANTEVWNKVINDFKNNTMECRYYNKYYCTYSYAKLYSEEKYDELLLPEQLILKQIDALFNDLRNREFSIDHLFLLNSVLLFKIRLYNYTDLLTICVKNLKEGAFRLAFPYYSSNIIYDKNLDNDEPVNYFGSSALTTALFLEFLTLYNKLNN